MARRPRKITPRSLENGALHYLGRFATSSANLKRVLMGRVVRSARAHHTDAQDGRALIDDLIARFERSGLLDDAAYARARTETLHKRGNSARLIRAKLRAKGVASDLIDDAVAGLTESNPNAELAAAAGLARRRRLGPHRAAEERQARREKDLAVLARAGFAYDVARRVVDAESAEALEDEISRED